MIDAIKGTPWAPLDGAHEQPVPVEVPGDADANLHVPPVPQPSPMQIRRMKIPREMYLKYGHADCKGCVGLRRGQGGRPHSAECVAKVEETLRRMPEWHARLERSQERITHHMARSAEEADLEEKARGSDAGGARGAAPAAAPSSSGAPAPLGTTQDETSKLSQTSPEIGGPMPMHMRGEVEDDPMEGQRGEEPLAKRARINVISIDEAEAREPVCRARVRGAIEGGVHWVVGSSTSPQGAAQTAHASLYQEQIRAGGRFLHVHEGTDIGSKPKDIMQLQHAMSVNMVHGNITVTTNSLVAAKAVCEMENVALARGDFQGISVEGVKQHVLDAVSNLHETVVSKDTLDMTKDTKLRCAKTVGQISTVVHDSEQCWDDVKGGWLPMDEVRKAREEEMRFVRKTPLYRKVDRAEAANKGQKVIPVRWVDTIKGTADSPNYRSRIVAMEFKKDQPRCNDHELFSAMPPIEAVRMVISHAASAGDGTSSRCILVADVRRAYFNAPARRPIYVEIPPEDLEEGDEHRCAELLASMYGTRDAARNWQEELKHVLTTRLGASVGVASPSVFLIQRFGRVVKIAIHGDDIVCAGEMVDLRWVERRLLERFQIKSEFVGLQPGCKREAKILNRLVRCCPEGFRIEADPRHANVLIDELKLRGSNPAATPIDDKLRLESCEGDALNIADTRKYRGLAARVNYLAIDRPDLKIASLIASRHMSTPTIGSWALLERIGRYLLGRPRIEWRFDFQGEPTVVSVCTDSDWASDRDSRRSISGGTMWIGAHLIKAWAKGQGGIAMSSMEAELYAGVLGAIEAKAVQSIAKDFGKDPKVCVAVDSSAALGFARREGLGKAKHVEIHWLWIQQESRAGRIALAKIDGRSNPADMLTKPLTRAEIDRHLEALGCAPFEV